MQINKLVNDTGCEKTWIMGPWNSNSPIEIGYLTKAKGTVHKHSEIFEYYVVLEGGLKLSIDVVEHELKKGEICLAEPEEVHGVIYTSYDLRCLLIKYPSRLNDKTIIT